MWVRIDDQIADHPKFVTAGPQAAWLWLCGLSYAARYLTDGFLPSSQVARLGNLKGTAALAKKLVTAGLWEVVEGGFRIHDYHDYQPSAQEIKEQREAARQRKQQERSGRTKPGRPAGQSPDVRPDAPARAYVGASRPIPVQSPSEHTAVVSREAEGTGAAGAATPPTANTNGHASGSNGTSLEPLLQAFDALGLKRPKLTGFEPKDARELLQHFEPVAIAQCWQAVASGAWGDDFSRRELSFSYLARNNRVGNWQRERESAAADDDGIRRVEGIRA